MRESIKKLIVAGSVFLSLLILIVLINQITQLTNSIATIHPIAGKIFLTVVLIGLLVSISIPLILFFRLSSPLIPPKNKVGKEYQTYFLKLKDSLNKNKRVPSNCKPLNTISDVENALEELDKISHKTIELTGKRAFFSTAISQNGALDVLFVLGLQAKLIWDIAHIYNQRPTIQDMGFLYSNVLITALIVTQIDEAEYFEMIESSITQGAGSAISLIPGSSLIVNSAITGSSNAFLTLRIGAITQQYCSSLTRPQRSTIRNSATSKAAKLLSNVVIDGTYKLVRSVGTAPFKKLYQSGSGFTDKMKDQGKSFFKRKKTDEPEHKNSGNDGFQA